jgi:hypothetical protein
MAEAGKAELILAPTEQLGEIGVGQQLAAEKARLHQAIQLAAGFLG